MHGFFSPCVDCIQSEIDTGEHRIKKLNQLIHIHLYGNKVPLYVNAGCQFLYGYL